MSNSERNIHTIIIGAGQAGLATSFFLTQQKIPHVVIDRLGVGSSWKHERWDSFTLVTPNWTIQLPGASYSGESPNAFLSRDEFVTWLQDWTQRFACPLISGVEVTRVGPIKSKFEVATTDGYWQSKNIVIATSTYQQPKRLPITSQIPCQVYQIDASSYRSPVTLPEGSILVVGSGQTGCQIAEELNDAGFRTYLSTGRSGRLPRRYRGRDSLEWQLDLGFLDRTPDMLQSPSDRFRGDPHVTGKGGGRTLSLHKFQRQGITLLGHLQDMAGTCLYFSEDVSDHLLFSDQFSLDFMTTVDEHIERTSLIAPLPTEEETDGGPLSTDKEIKNIRSLDIQKENIQTIVWATGFSFDFSWVDFPITDDFSYPIAKEGITDVTGLYFCGLNWMSKRKSGIIFGVHEDAHSVALDIANRS